MSKEQSKAAKRRFNDGAFHTRFFVGHGIDIGAGDDSLGQFVDDFALMRSCVEWEKEHGDAQYMRRVPDNQYDFVHSAHCLEHMTSPYTALENWVRICKPGGHVVVTVPDEDMYEHGMWPSTGNSDHKWSFTTCTETSLMNSINVMDLVSCLHNEDVEQGKFIPWNVSIERLTLHRDFYRNGLGLADQTKSPVAECSIEFVLQKL